jgi:glycosyltransferase involved in cell wall biosynthesis
LVLLEAAQLGIPFIATSVGSIPEVFSGSKTALLVEPRNVAALAAAMLTSLSESSEHREERRQAALELFRKLNSAEAVRARLQNLLQQVDALSVGPVVPRS